MFNNPGGTFPGQWALNPSAYQNMANDQVDWAALAQQWIMMKEACPPQIQQIPITPLPTPKNDFKSADFPHTNQDSHNNAPSFLSGDGVLNEGGEAPMEVDNEREDDNSNLSGKSSSNSNWANSNSNHSWSWQQQWNWNHTWVNPSASNNTAAPTQKTSLLPTPVLFNASQDANGSESQASYWNDKRNAEITPPAKKKRTQSSSSDIMHNSEITIDANKRRQLPAWIREGLEKREREIQKQLNRERELKEREEYEKRQAEEKEIARKIMQENGIIMAPSKSKFESDSEQSADEEETAGDKVKHDVKHTPQESSPARVKPTLPKFQAYAEIQDSMIKVRKIMTQVLLDVTSEEIHKICQDELKRYQSSASAVNMKKTPALVSLTDQLGLGIYGDSSSESDEDESQRNSNDNVKETVAEKKVKKNDQKDKRLDDRKQNSELERREVTSHSKTSQSKLTNKISASKNTPSRGGNQVDSTGSERGLKTRVARDTAENDHQNFQNEMKKQHKSIKLVDKFVKTDPKLSTTEKKTKYKAKSDSSDTSSTSSSNDSSDSDDESTSKTTDNSDVTAEKVPLQQSKHHKSSTSSSDSDSSSTTGGSSRKTKSKHLKTNSKRSRSLSSNRRSRRHSASRSRYKSPSREPSRRHSQRRSEKRSRKSDSRSQSRRRSKSNSRRYARSPSSSRYSSRKSESRKERRGEEQRETSSGSRRRRSHSNRSGSRRHGKSSRRY